MNIALYSLQEIRFKGLLNLNGAEPWVWWTLAAVLVIGAYFLGSINFAIYISKAAYNKDIRTYGSGNAGTTNVMRTFGTKAAAIVLLGDIMKAVISVTLTMLICGIEIAYIAGISCMLGHCFPIYYKFKGGKGFATAAGMVLAADPLIFLLCLIIFVIVVATTKYISAGSIMSAMLFPLFLNMFYGEGGLPGIMAICSVLLALLIIFNHRANIVRIWKREENKFSFKKSVSKEKLEEEENAPNGDLNASEEENDPSEK